MKQNAVVKSSSSACHATEGENSSKTSVEKLNLSRKGSSKLRFDLRKQDLLIEEINDILGFTSPRKCVTVQNKCKSRYRKKGRTCRYKPSSLFNPTCEA